LFRTESADALLERIDAFLGYCETREAPPFLCFYLHPWEFVPMPQGEIPYGEGAVRPAHFLVKNCGPYATEQFDHLIGSLLERGAVFRQARHVQADDNT
jgi:hypothetical protein